MAASQPTSFAVYPSSKALHCPLLACHVFGLAILVNQPREWLLGIPADLQQIANDQAFLGFREGQILKGAQARLNPLIPVILGTGDGGGNGLGHGQKLFQVGNRREALRVMRVFILPSCPKRSLGFTHFMVETRPPFRLISYWKRLGLERSGKLGYGIRDRCPMAMKNEWQDAPKRVKDGRHKYQISGDVMWN